MNSECKVSIISKSKLFIANNHYVVRFDGKVVKITPAPFDYKGRMFKCYASNSVGWLLLSVNIDIPKGHYLIDVEESIEDKIIVYLEDKI
jgi:hypothetical protein